MKTLMMVLALSILACDYTEYTIVNSSTDSTPVPPEIAQPPQLAGEWRLVCLMTYPDWPTLVLVDATMAVVQDGNNLTGTWNGTWDGMAGTGPITGTVDALGSLHFVVSYGVDLIFDGQATTTTLFGRGIDAGGYDILLNGWR